MSQIVRSDFKYKKSKWYQLSTKKRWILGIALLLGNFCASSMRTHLGVAMVCMINATAVHEQAKAQPNFIPEPEELSYGPQCHKIHSSNHSHSAQNGYKGTFTWSTEEQSLLFTASFYGNLAIMGFSGFLINHFGAKRVAFISAIGMSITTALMPTAAYLGLPYFFIARVLFGVFENPIYSALVAPLSLWFPPNERSTAAAFFTSGSPLASSLGVLIATNFCSLNFLNGWSLIFYFMSMVSLTWSLVWFSFFTNNPKDCKMLSIKEKTYLNDENVAHSHPEGEAKQPIPLQKMICSTATIAVMIATFAHYFTTSLMQNFLPSYARDILALDLKSNGMFTSMAFSFKLMSKYILSFTADYLKYKNILSPSTSCRIFQSAASFGVAAVFILLALYIDCTKQHEALAVLALYGIFAGSSIPGYFTSSCSFAPMYTGMVSSLMEGAGALGHVLAPVLVGFIVKHGRQNEWSIMFGLVILVNIFGGVIFLLFGTAKIQPWAQPNSSLKAVEATNPAKVSDEPNCEMWLNKKVAKEI